MRGQDSEDTMVGMSNDGHQLGSRSPAPAWQQEDALVTEAAEASFPASDPPAWSGLSITGADPKSALSLGSDHESASSETAVERIAREARERALVRALNRSLAVLLDLGTSYTHAHWNVRGPGFPTLYALFRAFADEVADAAEVIAQRAVTLGGTAEGTLQAAIRSSALRPLALDAVMADELVPALRLRAGQAADELRSALAASQEDEVTVRVLADALHPLERQLSLLSGRLLSARDPAI